MKIGRRSRAGLLLMYILSLLGKDFMVHGAAPLQKRLYTNPSYPVWFMPELHPRGLNTCAVLLLYGNTAIFACNSSTVKSWQRAHQVYSGTVLADYTLMHLSNMQAVMFG